MRLKNLCAPILLAAAFPSLCSAQGGFVERQIGFGARIALPATWQVASDSALSYDREAALERMRKASVQRLRELAASNENAALFHAREPAVPTNSANMNVTVAPQMKSALFGEMNANEINVLVSNLCRTFSAQATDAGGTGKCDRHELVTLEDRRAVVVYQTVAVVRAGLDNHRTVVLIPAPGLLFTLSISLRRDGYDAAIPRAIMASLKLPADLK